MIRAWILYCHLTTDTYHLEERDGTRFDNIEPTEWGLPNDEDYYIVATFQQARFLGAWIEGNKKDMLH